MPCSAALPSLPCRALSPSGAHRERETSLYNGLPAILPSRYPFHTVDDTHSQLSRDVIPASAVLLDCKWGSREGCAVLAWGVEAGGLREVAPS